MPIKKYHKTKIGVLALQGDFLEHLHALERLGVFAREVKLPNDLNFLDGLIIPGGESTAMALLLDKFHLRQPLVKKIRGGLAVWGTCAGLILLAKKIIEAKPAPLGILDITVSRNAYGRQAESFEADLKIPSLGKKPLPVCFIRAPKIISAEKNVAVLAQHNNTPVAVQQGNILGTAFHSELTNNVRLHQYFLKII